MHLMQVVPDTALQPLASLGVGGAVALVIFFFYRSDRKASEERATLERKESEERFANYRSSQDDRYEEIAKDFRMIVQQNTEASTRLAEVIDRMLEQ